MELEHYDANEVQQIDNRVKELSLHKDSEEMASQAYKFLMETCQTLKRRPVLLVDNIGLLFNRLSKNNQHSLRAVLSENGAPIILGAGVVILPSQTNNKANVVKAITEYEAPFYDYFQIHYLKKLTFDEFLDLIKNLASVTNSDISNINKERPRLQALHQLTGGNPRTAVMLFKLIVNGFSTEINDDLEALLDEITPLYKARYEEISEQSQKIIATIALNWDAINLKKLSQQSGYANNQLSPQLKRLIEEGWIETTPAEKAKGNAYYISERFFNIWFIMRMSTRRQKQEIYCLSRFLEYFYGEELTDVAARFLQKYNDAEIALKQAILLDNNDYGVWYCLGKLYHYHLHKYEKAEDAYKRALSIGEEKVLGEEKVFDTKYQLIYLYRDNLGKLEEAETLFNSIEKEIDLKSEGNLQIVYQFWLNKALFELYKHNEGNAKLFFNQILPIVYSELPSITSTTGKTYYLMEQVESNESWWQFAGVIFKLNYEEWLLSVLQEETYDIIMSPYYTAIQALKIEKQDSKNGKKEAEIYLKNRAVEIAEPARMIIEKIRKHSPIKQIKPN
jgi:DNA-binding MarR family transcriptional regulator